MLTSELVGFLNEYLAVEGFPDSPGAQNGLQVEGPKEVTKVALAVDACLATINAAAAAGAQMLIAHHGLFWSPITPVTGVTYRRLKALFDADLAVYSCHLPLDAHPEVGNCPVLLRRLGWSAGGTFGAPHDVDLGVWADVDTDLSDVVNRVSRTLSVTPKVIATGPAKVRRVGVITGGGGDMIVDAAACGIDTFITGEGAHHTYFVAEELGINVLYAGHYATETVGIEALAELLKQRLPVETTVITHPTGL